jgi:hypothetical protein
MSEQFVTAYTSLEEHPPFINFTMTPEGMRVIVRGKAGPREVYGAAATLTIPRDEWARMKQDLQDAP